MNKNNYSVERLEICKKCPLYKDGVCNHKLFLNPQTNDVSVKPKAGYFQGCNCVLKFKVRSLASKCPARKW